MTTEIEEARSTLTSMVDFLHVANNHLSNDKGFEWIEIDGGVEIQHVLDQYTSLSRFSAELAMLDLLGAGHLPEIHTADFESLSTTELARLVIYILRSSLLRFESTIPGLAEFESADARVLSKKLKICGEPMTWAALQQLAEARRIGSASLARDIFPRPASGVAQ